MPMSFPADSVSVSVSQEPYLSIRNSCSAMSRSRTGRIDPGTGCQRAGRSAAGMGLTYLFVAHDLSMVRHISDRIGVMYLGKIVESGESDEVYDNPCHPIHRALLAPFRLQIRSGTQSGTLRHRGRSSESVACSVRLSFPYALSLRDRSVQTAGYGTGRENTGPYVACWKK